jgi:hypothetical protein
MQGRIRILGPTCTAQGRINARLEAINFGARLKAGCYPTPARLEAEDSHIQKQTKMEVTQSDMCASISVFKKCNFSS